MLKDKSYLRLKNYLKQGMPFLADPPMDISEKYKGIIEYPGFHTTTDFNIAASYALGRVSASFTEEDEEGKHYVTDYPVVVAVDMEGFEKHTDYDAEKIVKEILEIDLKELIRFENLSESSSDEEILDAAQGFIENGSDQSDDIASSPLDFISQSTFSVHSNPIGGIIDLSGFPDMIRNFSSTGEIPPQFLMDATAQYRYLDDVEEDKVRAVWFIMPVAGVALDYASDDEGENEEELNNNWPGFDIMDQDSLYSGNVNFNQTLVYGDTSAQNVEYHGTTYLRFKSAAPGVEIPPPPSPPYIGE